jgi:hypothetical protein
MRSSDLRKGFPKSIGKDEPVVEVIVTSLDRAIEYQIRDSVS